MARLSFLQAKQVYPQRMIYQDYLAGTKKLARFYRWYPATEQALLARATELASFGNPRVRLSEVLVQYNRQILASPATIQNASLLAEPQTLAVVTGQQPGFAGGPLEHHLQSRFSHQARAVSPSSHRQKRRAGFLDSLGRRQPQPS